MFDEEHGTLDGIKARHDPGTVVQKPFQFGYLSSKWLHELATKARRRQAAIPADVIDTGVEVIDKDNVADFEDELAEMKKSSLRRAELTMPWTSPELTWRRTQAVAFPLLQMRGITKRFPGVIALQGVSLHLARAARCSRSWARTGPARAR